MAHKTKKKPARKLAKKPVRRMTRSASPRSRASRTKVAPRAPKKKTTAVKVRKKVRKTVKPAKTKALKKPTKTMTRAAKPKVMARKAIRGIPAKKVVPAKITVPAPIAAKPAPAKRMQTTPPARLQRERRRLPEVEQEESFTEATDDSRMMSSARAGHDELRSEIRKHTASSPTMTAGDVDARWQEAYALGDEAPGGDNMTPDQDRVDDIGKALGIEYADDEELLGGVELTERDEHRWELDPASKEDDEDL